MVWSAWIGADLIDEGKPGIGLAAIVVAALFGWFSVWSGGAPWTWFAKRRPQADDGNSVSRFGEDDSAGCLLLPVFILGALAIAVWLAISAVRWAWENPMFR
ncbi:MAG TPA: hypothetical protein VG734_23125 [Lacunisphaera sp.]|nr:hypothetical protein [Lacunisphaera sp.]